MSLMPTLEIGLWNAWTLILLLVAAALIPLYIDHDKSDKRSGGEPAGSGLSRTTRIAYVITYIILPFTFIHSVFVPLKLGTLWFVAGLAIYLLGLPMVLVSSISFSTAPLGQPISRGVYAISRHPTYFGSFLAYVGIGLACASWVFLLCALKCIASCYFGAIEEERFLLKKYGDAYGEYMNRTLRWIGIPRRK